MHEYTPEERVEYLEGLWERTRILIEKNLPKAVKTKCKDCDCPTLLTNAAARTIKEGDLHETCGVLLELIKHEIKELGCLCLMEGITKEFDSEKNTFWIECEIIPLSKREEDTKKLLEELLKNTTKETMNSILKETIRLDIERLMMEIMQQKYRINIGFGSPS